MLTSEATLFNYWLSIVAYYSTIIGAAFTIGGVLLAAYIYKKWKSDYKIQRAHEYALDLLKKVRLLHLSIEQLRGPKFYRVDDVYDLIKEHFINEIDERVFKRVNEIQVDLLIAKESLVQNHDLRDQFNSLVMKKVISPINSAVIQFNIKMQPRSDHLGNPRAILFDDVVKTELWKILYPYEGPGMLNSQHGTKESMLGLGQVVNDDYNKDTEYAFSKIYELLEVNLAV